MLVKAGIDQLLRKNRGRFFSSVLAVSLGVMTFFTMAVVIDTVNNAFVVQENFIYSNIDYTIYRGDTLFSQNDTFTIPSEYEQTIANFEGVNGVVARKGRHMQAIDATDYLDSHSLRVFSMNVSNPSESTIGRGITIDCLDEIGNPGNVTLEMLLSSSLVANPAVVSNEIANEKGWNVGDDILISAQNMTKAYATSEELLSVANGTITAIELEQQIRNDKDRWLRFTIVGIFLDGTEAPMEPRPHKANSLTSIVPDSNTIYINQANGSQFVFNKDDGAFYYLLNVDKAIFDGEQLLATLNTNANGTIPFQIFDVKEFLHGFIEYAVTWARLFFMLIGVFGIMVASALIQSVSEINLEEQYKEIGILTSLGFNKRRILELVVPQILIISTIGTLVGFFTGYFLGSQFELEAVIRFLSYNKTYNIEVEIPVVFSFVSALLTVAAGFVFPLVYGLAPFRKLSSSMKKKSLKSFEIQDFLEPEKISEATANEKEFLARHLKELEKSNKKRRKWGNQRGKEEKKQPNNLVIEKRKKQKRIINHFVLPLLLMVVSFIGMYWASTNVFDSDFTTAGSRTYIYLGIIALCALFFIISTLTFFGDIISIMTAGISRLFRNLGRLQEFIPTRVRSTSKTRARKNHSNQLVICTIIVVSLFIIYQSSTNRDVEVHRTIIGGDAVVYSPMITRSDMLSLQQSIPSIQDVNMITYATMEGVSLTKEFSSQLLVNKIDGFGGMGNNVSQMSNIIIIHDVEAYLRTNPASESIYEIIRPLFTSHETLFRTLKRNGTVIIQDTPNIAKSVGEHVEVESFGIRMSLEVAGVVKFVPSAPMMRSPDNALLKRATIVTTRDTILSALSSHLNGADIMIKNKDVGSFVENTTIPEDYVGYSSGLIDVPLVEGVLSSISGIQHSNRFSTFYPKQPKITTQYNPERIIYQRENASVNVSGKTELNMRLFAYDALEEKNVGSQTDRVIEAKLNYSQQILSGAYDGPRVYNRTVDELLYASDYYMYSNNFATRNDTLGSLSYCVVNKYVAIYESVDTLSYVHENRVGDVLMVEFKNGPDTFQQGFEIIGLVDSHLPYIHTNATEKEGLVLSWKSLNYNSNQNSSESVFIDIFDVDANVFYTSLEEFAFIEYLNTKSPFGFASDKMVNHVLVRVEDAANIDQTMDAISQGLTAAGLVNYSVFNLKQSFLDALGLYGSFHFTLTEGANEIETLKQIREWYIANNYTWRESSVNTVLKLSYNNDLFLVGEAFSLLFIIAVIMLILGQFALANNIHMQIKKNRREYGILKVLGFSRKQTTGMVAIETAIPTAFSTVLGILMGLAIMWVVIQAMSTSLILPLRMVIPYEEILLILGVTFLTTAINSFSNMRYVMKLPPDMLFNTDK